MAALLITTRTEVAMIDSVITHALIGNKSHKSKLEAVRLQIVALRAVEAQIEQWMLADQRAEQERAEKSVIMLSDEDMQRITNLMASEGLIRASVQSPSWAGIAAIRAMQWESMPASERRDMAERAIDTMLAAGVIQKARATDTRQGRQMPIYVIPNLPQAASQLEENLRKGEYKS
jgi:hypothetical protein